MAAPREHVTAEIVALGTPEVPYVFTATPAGVTGTWDYADARWAGLMAAGTVDRTYRLVVELHDDGTYSLTDHGSASEARVGSTGGGGVRRQLQLDQVPWDGAQQELQPLVLTDRLEPRAGGSHLRVAVRLRRDEGTGQGCPRAQRVDRSQAWPVGPAHGPGVTGPGVSGSDVFGRRGAGFSTTTTHHGRNRCTSGPTAIA